MRLPEMKRTYDFMSASSDQKVLPFDVKVVKI